VRREQVKDSMNPSVQMVQRERGSVWEKGEKEDSMVGTQGINEIS